MAEIPSTKRYFRIGEASRIIGVEPHVLRYWESEFPQIRPQRADSNQRTYQRKDLELILEIKRLLYDEKITIEGVKQRLKHPLEQQKSKDSHPLPFTKDLVKRELEDILKILS
jgi:DNA-binding transcriptional MerR regulator